MSGLKRELLGLRGSGTTMNGVPTPTDAITPDEIDRYEVYTIINPACASGLATKWVGTTVVSGTADTRAFVAINAILDYPRNLEFALTGTGVGMAGTATVNGRDQFGGVISEVFGFGSADNGGTVVGTKVFAQYSSGTVLFGTAAGNGTTRLGVGTLGTTTLFGLPFKLGGTTDVKTITVTAGTGAVTVNGGTIAAYVNVPMHAIQAPLTLAGTYSIQTWVRPTYNSENQGLVANLAQRT